MNSQHLLNVFELEGRLLDTTLRHHQLLRPLFSRDFHDVDSVPLSCQTGDGE